MKILKMKNDMAKGKINGVINIPSSLERSFFRYWLEFLFPFHNLTNREMNVATAFLKHRFILGKAIKDDIILDKVVMSDDIKRKVREECSLTSSHFQIIVSKLKKAKFIVDGRINPKFIPKNIEDGDKSFQLLLHFDFNEEGN